MPASKFDPFQTDSKKPSASSEIPRSKRVCARPKTANPAQPNGWMNVFVDESTGRCKTPKPFVDEAEATKCALQARFYFVEETFSPVQILEKTNVIQTQANPRFQRNEGSLVFLTQITLRRKAFRRAVRRCPSNPLRLRANRFRSVPNRRPKRRRPNPNLRSGSCRFRRIHSP